MTTPRALATLLIALGVLTTGAIAGFAVADAETVMRTGRQVFIALRPVDPRSLLQGDYMAIAFDTSRLPSPQPGNGTVDVIATLDDRAIATLTALAPAKAVAPSEILVRLRTKSKRWFVGSDAWFFGEGQGKRYEAARFGVFRVSPEGRPLLVGLADKDLTILSPGK